MIHHLIPSSANSQTGASSVSGATSAVKSNFSSSTFPLPHTKGERIQRGPKYRRNSAANKINAIRTDNTNNSAPKSSSTISQTSHSSQQTPDRIINPVIIDYASSEVSGTNGSDVSYMTQSSNVSNQHILTIPQPLAFQQSRVVPSSKNKHHFSHLNGSSHPQKALSELAEEEDSNHTTEDTSSTAGTTTTADNQDPGIKNQDNTNNQNQPKSIHQNQNLENEKKSQNDKKSQKSSKSTLSASSVSPSFSKHNSPIAKKTTITETTSSTIDATYETTPVERHASINTSENNTTSYNLRKQSDTAAIVKKHEGSTVLQHTQSSLSLGSSSNQIPLQLIHKMDSAGKLSMNSKTSAAMSMEANLSSGTSKKSSLSRSSSSSSLASSTTSELDANAASSATSSSAALHAASSSSAFAAAIEQARRNTAAVNAATQMVNLFGAQTEQSTNGVASNKNNTKIISPTSQKPMSEHRNHVQKSYDQQFFEQSSSRTLNGNNSNRARAASAAETASAVDAASHRPISPETSSSLQSSSFVVSSSTNSLRSAPPPVRTASSQV